MTFTAPVVHTIQQDHGPVFHAENVKTYDRVDDLQEEVKGMQREVKALCGKGQFGKNAYDLCLVPNVVIPPKLKVPDFEKYNGNTNALTTCCLISIVSHKSVIPNCVWSREVTNQTIFQVSVSTNDQFTNTFQFPQYMSNFIWFFFIQLSYR